MLAFIREMLIDWLMIAWLITRKSRAQRLPTMFADEASLLVRGTKAPGPALHAHLPICYLSF
jgi:hypothetical protein